LSASPDLRGKIQTVEGLLAPEQLGPTLMHEHVLCDITPPELATQGGSEVEITLENVWDVNYHWGRYLGNSRLNEEEVAVQELERFHQVGGKTIVELSNVGTKRDPVGLRRIAEKTGINIIMGCGYYTEGFLPPEIREMSVKQMAQEMLSEILYGVNGTDIRAGIIGEIGCSYPWTPFEIKVMEAAITVQQETGAAISVHPGRHPEAPCEIVTMVKNNGADAGRTIVGHIDRTLFDFEALLHLAETGCVVEFDFFGIESSYYPFQDIDLPNDGMRLNIIRKLIDAGFLSQIVISHDICTKTRLACYGGHGYGHILRNVLPMMQRKGFTDEEVDVLLVRNPRRVLTFA
jgi:phosphotriesterase-related protein